MYNDRELLAKTLMAEAGNQGPLGMLAAGSVIMNRVRSGNYGKGLPGVILKPGAFSPWNSVTGFAGGEQGQDMARITPNEQAYRIADALLSGQYEDPTGNATHFYNPDISDPSWGIRGGNEWRRIGEHVFGRADDKAKGPSRVINVGSDAPKLVASDTMAALGKGGGAVTPDQIAQGAQAQSTGMQDEQRPRGLLGGLFGNPDTMANLALAFNSMRLNPDPNLGAVLTAQMKERRGERQAAAQKNRTIDYLRSLGTPQAMEAIRYAEGTGDIAGALKMATAAGKDDRTALIKNFEYAKSQGFEGSLQDFMKAGGGGGTVVNVGGEGVKLTPFQKKRDEAFAEKMIDWSSTGAVDSSRQVAQISSVMKQFEAGKPLTGPLFAAIDAVGLSSIFSPEAKQAKDTVEQVVQRSLRETLGGQFAEREGERLIQRAYNPSLPPEANLARLKGLFEQLSFADQAKRAMIEYANKNGTLVGYEGPEIPTASQIEAAMDSAYKPDEVKTPQSGGGGASAATQKSKRIRYDEQGNIVND